MPQLNIASNDNSKTNNAIYAYAIYRYDETSLQQPEILDIFPDFNSAMREVFEMCKGDIGNGECEYFDTPQDLQGDDELGGDQYTTIAQYKDRDGSIRWAHWGYEVGRINRSQVPDANIEL